MASLNCFKSTFTCKVVQSVQLAKVIYYVAVDLSDLLETLLSYVLEVYHYNGLSSIHCFFLYMLILHKMLHTSSGKVLVVYTTFVILRS